MSDEHLRRIKMVIHLINLIFKDERPVYPATYRAGPTTKQFYTAEISRKIAEKVVERTKTEWVTLLVFAYRTEILLRF